MSANTDDDDISAFMQDIDTRKPLGTARDGPPSPAPLPLRPHGREATIREESSASSSSGGTVVPPHHMRERTASLPAPGPYTVPSTEAGIDERLQEMKETFLASLEGLGRGSRRREQAQDERERERVPGASSDRGTRFPGDRRRESPLASPGDGGSGEGSEVGSSGGVVGLGIAGVPLPRAYVRPRLASTGSVRSGFSIASEEVIGRMDPEVTGSGEERRRSRGPLTEM